MTKEFNLSSKRWETLDGDEFETGEYAYNEKDVKEFIKKIKYRISFVMNNSDYTEDDIMLVIKKLAGDELI